MKMTAFWDMAPCSLVAVDRRFRGAYLLHHPRPENGAERTQRNISEGYHIHCIYSQMLLNIKDIK
jgi:hypothetical protein